MQVKVNNVKYSDVIILNKSELNKNLLGEVWVVTSLLDSRDSEWLFSRTQAECDASARRTRQSSAAGFSCHQHQLAAVFLSTANIYWTHVTGMPAGKWHEVLGHSRYKINVSRCKMSVRRLDINPLLLTQRRNWGLPGVLNLNISRRLLNTEKKWRPSH